MLNYQVNDFIIFFFSINNYINIVANIINFKKVFINKNLKLKIINKYNIKVIYNIDSLNQ